MPSVLASCGLLLGAQALARRGMRAAAWLWAHQPTNVLRMRSARSRSLPLNGDPDVPSKGVRWVHLVPVRHGTTPVLQMART